MFEYMYRNVSSTSFMCNVLVTFYNQDKVMQQWTRISAVLSVFGFLKEIQPSEPYVAEYTFLGTSMEGTLLKIS